MATWYWETPEKITAVEWCIPYRTERGVWRSDRGIGLVVGETRIPDNGPVYLMIGGPYVKHIRYLRPDQVKPMADEKRLAHGLFYPHEVTA
jgi:hypothetical protein